MKKSLCLTITVLLSLGIGVSAEAKSRSSAKTEMFDANGKSLGKIQFTKNKDGVLVKADLKADSGVLTTGFHGFHIHAVGDCTYTTTTSTTPFGSASGHFEKAGTDTDHKDHNGDMPVLLVNPITEKDQAKGRAFTTFVTNRFTIDDLFDDSGKGRAVIIHAAADNFANIPTRYAITSTSAEGVVSILSTGPDSGTKGAGDAGTRIACGIIK